MKAFAPISLISLCCAFPAFSQETDINSAEMQKALQNTEQAMQQSAQNLNQAIGKVMPEIAESMNKSLTEILGTFPQLFSAMEENRIFSKTSEQMLKELKASLDEMQISAENYKIENFHNNLSVSGSQNQNSVGLDFLITQDPMTIALTREYLDNKKSPTPNALSITALNGKQLELSAISIENINDNPFLCYDEKDYTFIIGNLGYDANVKIETRGKDHKQQARDFIKSVNGRQLK